MWSGDDGAGFLLKMIDMFWKSGWWVHSFAMRPQKPSEF